MKKSKPTKPICGIIPSQSAMRYCVYQLRKMQYGAMRDALVIERAGDNENSKSLLLQAHDMQQVAQYLEERLLP